MWTYFQVLAGSLLVGGIATVNAQTSDEAIEEVIVTGIRASLQDAIAKKRNADDIRDVINAEDCLLYTSDAADEP